MMLFTRKDASAWLCAFSLLLLPCQSFAGMEDELRELKERLLALEKKQMEMEKTHKEMETGLKDELAELRVDVDRVDYRSARIKALDQKVGAFTIGGDLTFFMQGFTSNRDSKTDGSFSGDLFLTIPAGPYGNVFLRGDVGEGKGIAGSLPPTYSGPNADLEFNEPKFTLAEAWYRTSFPIPDVKDQRIELTLGKLDPTAIFDANAVANSETSQFVADLFVNNLALEFAGDDNGYGPGAALGYRFTSPYQKGLEVWGRVGLFEGDRSGEGTFSRVFDNPFVIAELDIATSYYGLGGNYRIYGWKNQNKHTAWDDPADNDKSNQGFGLSVDQKVSDDVTLFARYGMQDEEVSKFDHVFTVGGQIVGNAWKRANDVVGVAYGLSRTSGKYKDNSLAVDGYNARGDEHYLEAYYKYWANKNLSISPDIQYIMNPGGNKDEDDIFLFGVRMQLVF